MNLSNIQTFLSVANHQSLSVAASMLYLSQPTVSARLRQLEEELGVTLIVRKKGVRTVELTPQGLAFIPLAERWMALEAETAGFAKEQYLAPLTIACPDSLNNYLFPELYRRLPRPEQNLALRIRTRNSPVRDALMELQSQHPDGVDVLLRPDAEELTQLRNTADVILRADQPLEQQQSSLPSRKAGG